VTDPLTRLRQDYRAAFVRYLSRRDEAALRAAYETGRTALSAGIGLLDVVQVHHAVLLGELRAARDPGELQEVGDLASAFLVEVLAPYEMTRLRHP
jgi:Phosphoserine phosphatase RsbU, N-terminal domain